MSRHEELSIGVLSLGDSQITANVVSPSSVITASAESFQSSVVKTGDIIKTMIAIDLTGLKSATTNKDIIGNTGVSYIAQITTAVNGVIYKGQISCGEVPTVGDDDIDLYQSSVATGAYDADASALSNAAVLMTSGGAYAIGTVKPLTVLPTADYYLYLATGDTTAGTYTAGRILIELWGTVA